MEEDLGARGCAWDGAAFRGLGMRRDQRELKTGMGKQTHGSQRRQGTSSPSTLVLTRDEGCQALHQACCLGCSGGEASNRRCLTLGFCSIKVVLGLDVSDMGGVGGASGGDLPRWE